MTALYCDPHELAGILRERQDSYEFVARGSVGYYEGTLDFGASLAGIRSECAHGVWMKTLRELGWSYSVCNRAIKLHSLGVSAAELARDGAKAVLKRFARPRRPAGAGEAKFGAGAKFAEPLETPPGAGTEDGKFCSAARFEPPPGAPESVEAAAPPDAPEEPVPEDDDVAEPDPPLPGTEDDPERPDELALEGGAGDKPPREALLPEGYKHGRPDHRMVNAITWPGLVGVEPRVLALLTFRDGGKGAFVSNRLIAHHLGVSKARVKQCLRKLRKLGLVHSTERENEVSLHTVFPEGTPERRQRELTLLRTFDGGKQATPGREADSPGEGNLAQPGGEADFPQNRTLNRTGNSRGGWRHSGQARMAAIDEGIAEYWDEEDAG